MYSKENKDDYKETINYKETIDYKGTWIYPVSNRSIVDQMDFRTNRFREFIIISELFILFLTTFVLSGSW